MITCAVGGPETAHQIVNTSNAELKYLAVSTRLSPEVCDYPDSEKFGVYAEMISPAASRNSSASSTEARAA